MLQEAQYSNHMRIGQGFNSYTHETRIDNAVRVVSRRPTGMTAPCKRDSAVFVDDTSPASTSSHSDTPAVSQSQNDTSKGPTKAPQNASTKSLAPQPVNARQSVTYSSWQIDNVSDVADALNISTYALVKYATVQANTDATMIHSTKINDSQLNYVVSVKVSNESPAEQDSMEFLPLADVPPERFTPVYGDCFISDFLHGGSFQAVISIKVNNKDKLRQVKEAVSFQLSVPSLPSFSPKAGEAANTDHSEAYHNTETTISVKVQGGGVVRPAGDKWTVDSVIAVANAFPALVAANPCKTSAILTSYNALKSFQDWKWKMSKDPSWASFVNLDDHWEDRLIFSYAPCKTYTAALFQDLVAFKTLDGRIKAMIDNPSQYSTRRTSRQSSGQAAPQDPLEASTEPVSPDINRTGQLQKLARGHTFGIVNPDRPASWLLKDLDRSERPIPMELAALKDAALVCRAALTLITEEAARLVDHPGLAAAEFDEETQRIKINKPNYPMPEVLAARLPLFTRNDANDDTLSDDGAVIATLKHIHDNDLFFHVLGDLPNAGRWYTHFCTLDESESITTASTFSNEPTRIALHGYQHGAWKLSAFSRESQGAIGAIGFSFRIDATSFGKVSHSDGCTWHYGGRRAGNQFCHALDLNSMSDGDDKIDITQLEVCYVPGTGRIAALTLFEDSNGGGDEQLPTLWWRQWEQDSGNGRQPEGLKKVIQTPPNDGGKWQFVGLCGTFDESIWGRVLSRVSGIWRRM